MIIRPATLVTVASLLALASAEASATSPGSPAVRAARPAELRLHGGDAAVGVLAGGAFLGVHAGIMVKAGTARPVLVLSAGGNAGVPRGGSLGGILRRGTLTLATDRLFGGATGIRREEVLGRGFSRAYGDGMQAEGTGFGAGFNAPALAPDPKGGPTRVSNNEARGFLVIPVGRARPVPQDELP